MDVERTQKIVYDKDLLINQEKRLDVQPHVRGYLSLAESYAAIGCYEDALRVRTKAERLNLRWESRKDVKGGRLFSGELTREILLQIIQMLHHTKCTGELVLEMYRFTAHIYFNDGELIHVHGGREKWEGLSCLKTMLSDCTGFFHFIQRSVRSIPHTITVGCQAFILEAMEHVDVNE